MTDTNAQGYITLDNGEKLHLFGISTGGVFTDGSEAEVYVKDIAGNQSQLWKVAEGRVITEIAIQAADGSILTTCKIYSPKGGVIASWRGNERTASDTVYNLRVKGLAIPIFKGTIMKLNTAD